MFSSESIGLGVVGERPERGGALDQQRLGAGQIADQPARDTERVDRDGLTRRELLAARQLPAPTSSSAEASSASS